MTFEEYEKNAAATAIYPGRRGEYERDGNFLGLMYVALKMNGEAGEFAEHLGKALRDENLGMGEGLRLKKRELLIKEVGDVLWYLSAAAHELNTTLSEVAQINNAKLLKRQEENKLKGSGDER